MIFQVVRGDGINNIIIWKVEEEEVVKIEMRHHISCMVDLEGLGFDEKWKEEIKAIFQDHLIIHFSHANKFLARSFHGFFLITDNNSRKRSLGLIK